MGNYTIDPPSPGASTKYTVEPPSSADRKPDTSNLDPLVKATDPSPLIRGTGEFFGAMPQGVLGIPEAIYQYAEHVAPGYVPHPGHWADPLRRYRDWADSTWPGVAGETVGNIGAFIGGGELADALGFATRLPSIITRGWNALSPAARTEISTLVQSQVAQPTKGNDFWTQKGESAFLAHLLGRWFGRPAQQAQHNIATTTNAGRAAQDAADAQATQQANAAAVQAARQANAADVQATRQANAADAAAHKNLTTLDKEQHQALADAQEQFHQQQRAAAQRAADALAEQGRQAQAARQARIDAKAAVPGSTTQGWWDRTLGQIGVTDPALTRATPATGAKVRDVVGGRLNSIMEGMNLDRDDPALMEHLNDIRDETERNLPENERAGWFHQPPEPELNPLLIHPTTGKPLERTTRGVKEKEPAPPTGTFYRTVIAPLKQGSGPMTGRDLTNYVSRIGARAEELAKEAAVSPRERRVVLQAQADALRNVEDAIIGHAAGTPEQKTALESARRAYFMWAIGNDAARASRNGVATPAQLINSMTRRLRGEARYQQALNNPDSPYHDMTNWLQSQLTAHTAQVPSAAQVRAAQPTPPPTMPMHPTPIPSPRPRTVPTPRQPPTPRPMPTPQPPPPPRPQERVWPPPARPQRNVRRAVTETAGAGMLAALGHPIWAAGTLGHAISNIIGHGTGGREKAVERLVRMAMENWPRTQRAATAVGGSTAGQAPRQVSPKVRKVEQQASDALTKAGKNMFYKWVGQ